MIKQFNSNKKRLRRHKRVRAKISGSAVKPRLNVYRSAQNIYAQVIDDTTGKTLASASTIEKEFSAYGGNCAAAALVGTKIAEVCKGHGIENVVFDRGGYLYHGRVKALADAARAGGLNF